VAHREDPGYLLVVDDDDAVRETLTALLSAEGYTVASAENGQAALEHISRSGLPALMLLDLNMPVLNGWGVLAALQRDAALAAIPVVVTTGDQRRPTTADGAAAVLEKPMEAEELLSVIAGLLAPSRYVLLVEDDADMRRAAIDALATYGYRSVGVGNGHDALAHLQASPHPPLAIVTDLEMPAMHGWDLLRALERSPSLSAIPVLIITGNIPPGHLASHWRVLRKPFSLTDLVREIDAVAMEGKRRTATPDPA
jgi:CheY-like chemotaxis protein